jgi:hypothetical protein
MNREKMLCPMLRFVYCIQNVILGIIPTFAMSPRATDIPTDTQVGQLQTTGISR